MKTIKIFIVTVVLLVVLGAAYIYSGAYPIGADVPHNALTYGLLETLRDRSVEVASEGIKVPDLNKPEILLEGGRDYAEMCAGCHLKPGLKQTEISVGLYPEPPNLSIKEVDEDGDSESPADEAREDFWVIKHGIKASGMAAWGKTHDDHRIWAMVAFIRKLPTLSAAEYQVLTAGGDKDDDHSDPAPSE